MLDPLKPNIAAMSATTSNLEPGLIPPCSEDGRPERHPHAMFQRDLKPGTREALKTDTEVGHRLERLVVALRRMMRTQIRTAKETYSIMHAARTGIGLTAAAVVVLWAGIIIHLIAQRDTVTEDAARDSINLAYAAEQSIGGMIDDVDQILLAVRAAYVSDPKSFDLDHWTSEVLRRSSEIAIVEKNGILRPSPHDPATAPIDVSDHAYFSAHLNGSADTLVIGQPVRLRTGGWSLQFSRGMTAPDGAFAGVVVLSMDPAWLTRLYNTIDIGQGALMVVGTDGIVRARASKSDVGVGENITSADLLKRSMLADHGTFRTVSPVDGQDRIVSFQRLADRPLVVAAGLDVRDVYGPYWHDRLIYLAAGAILTLLIMLVGARMIIQNRHLLQSRQVLSDAVENISQGLLLIDEDRQLPLINSRAIELLDLPPELLARHPSFDELVAWQMSAVEFGRGTEDEKRFKTLAQIPGFDLHDACYERTRPDGRVLEVRTQVLASGGAVRTYTDISERKHAEDRIRHMAHHDTLTGLANRTLLNDRLSQALHQAKRNGGSFALLALDLDRFKAINDGFGHDCGDQVLVELSRRLQGVLRATDTLARVGGDEFIVLQTEVGQPLAAGELARRLIDVLSAEFHVGGGPTVTIGASIGISLYPGDAASADSLLKNADTALYRAKASGRGVFCFFEMQMDQQMQERKEMERDLRLAIGTEQIYLVFQPIFAMATQVITGFEALLRWWHPVRGNIAPMSFIPLADASGLIVPLGIWVLEQACRAAVAWPEPKRLAVNLSAVQLRGGDLVAQVADVLRRTGLPAQRLELEVTETLLIDNPGKAMATLRELQGMGVHIACDDFGTGYSSFSYLQNLTFDRIKIDRSFVQGLESNSSAPRVVHAILLMARSLGIAVTAEGVETERQFTMLRELRCGEVQGFLLSKPISNNEVAGYLGQASIDQAALRVVA